MTYTSNPRSNIMVKIYLEKQPTNRRYLPILRCVMVSSLFGQSKIVKMLPLQLLDSRFLYEQTKQLVSVTRSAEGTLIAIVCDINRIKLLFFEMFDPNAPMEDERHLFVV